VHTLLAEAAKAKQWPHFRLPAAKASLTVLDVLSTPEQTKIAEFVHERLTVECQRHL